ncbi:MAG: hypothetical protein COW03_17300 [Cytophagales bacterium CG12_big_fil_rev_8_21_14_0_65_40_12]|nr:MAG: hypothetical protein COW03_17300 [Cytophagales bacterium CG12_big_fil_rev_8_21_14_0_65_40_12]PIW02964.1 MAG: hypothetical protein COW40_16565 [Cytophagales bacterium CG17_big_fil_post_rev_8_21_14_2_50_40_13]
MENTLHILNGDSSKLKFEQSRIKGTATVWRDVLSDGPVSIDFASPDFWQSRKTFFSSFFGVISLRYEQDVIAEFKKIQKFNAYDEVVLWFEYDLFCQINLIALLHWFKNQEIKAPKISLICVGWEEGFEGLVGLGEIPTDDYPSLYERRRILGSNDFNLASDAYLAYCSEDPRDLETFILLPSNEFPYLGLAFMAHLKRFPSSKTGFNVIEEKIMELINEGNTNLKSLIRELLKWQHLFGFGDLQYLKYLENLKPIFKDFENLELKRDFDSSMIKRDYYLGGANASDWLWDDELQEIKLKAHS